MVTLHSAQEDESENPPDGLAEAGVFPDFAVASEHGLVVLAMGLSYWLMPSAAGHRLLVETDRLAEVREQFALFDRESIGWPPKLVAQPALRGRSLFFTPLCWAFVVLAAFQVQQQGAGRWEAWGALDPAAVFGRGEWWRLFTALFLHADLGHLVSNVLFGLFVFAAVLSAFGLGGWLWLGCAAGAGNFAAAALRGSAPYVSIGASTAVFAGIGLLTGRAVRVALRSPRGASRWRTIGVPLGAGLILLGLLGAGDFRTDVLAHATGFAAGLLLGFAATRRLAC